MQEGRMGVLGSLGLDLVGNGSQWCTGGERLDLYLLSGISQCLQVDLSFIFC